MGFAIGKAKASVPGEGCGFIPNPKLKLLDQVSEVMRFKLKSDRKVSGHYERNEWKYLPSAAAGAFLNSELVLSPCRLTLARSRMPGRAVRTSRCACESAGASDDRCWPSSGAPADFSPRSTPEPASTSARLCGNESVAGAAPPPAVVRATRHGRADSCVPGLAPLAEVAATTPPQEFSLPAPSIRVRARCADGAIVDLAPPHRSTGASLPNPHPVCQWDKHSLESRIQPVFDFANRLV